MRPASELLMTESTALRVALRDVDEDAFDRATVCDGWSVRDVIAHCAAALTRTASGDLHDFSPEANQTDVDARKTWDLADLLDELHRGYRDAAAAIDEAAGRLDGVGLGEWIHGGDIREGIGLPGAYASEGSDMALDLLLDRSALQKRRGVIAHIDGVLHHFGRDDDMRARLVTDLETFVRLCGGRRPDTGRYELLDATPDDLVLFR
jgi:uncharacterized protein (TIGR03083 family)